MITMPAKRMWTSIGHFRHKIVLYTHHPIQTHTHTHTWSDRHSHSKQIRFLNKQIISTGNRQQCCQCSLFLVKSGFFLWAAGILGFLRTFFGFAFF